MIHIKEMLATSQKIKQLKAQLKEGGKKEALLSLLSKAQRQEIKSLTYHQGVYTLRLKRAYALYGIRAAMRNAHVDVRILVDPR